MLPLVRSLSTAHFAACWLFLSRSTATMMELSLATGSCSLLCEEVTEKGEANIFNGEHHWSLSLSQCNNQLPAQWIPNKQIAKGRRIRGAKRRGERDKREFCLSSPVALFCPARPALTSLPRLSAVIEPPKTANAFSGSFAVSPNLGHELSPIIGWLDCYGGFAVPVFLCPFVCFLHTQ